MKPLDYKGMSGVYKLTNSRGEFYIGSSKDIYSRFRQHKCRNTMKDSIHNITAEILEVSEVNLRQKEQVYILKYWSDKILNIEKVSSGRDISGTKNPMYRIIRDMFCLDCSKSITYHPRKQPKRCKRCSTKQRKRDEVTKTFI